MTAMALSTSIHDVLVRGGESISATHPHRGVGIFLLSPAREEAEIIFRSGMSLDFCGLLSRRGGRDLLDRARRTPGSHVMRGDGLPELRRALEEEGLGGVALHPLLGEESVLGHLVLGLLPEEAEAEDLDASLARVRKWDDVNRRVRILREEAGRAVLRSLLAARDSGGGRGVEAILVLDEEDRILLSHGVSNHLPSWGRTEVLGHALKTLPGGRVLAGMEASGSGHVEWRTRKVLSGEKDLSLSLSVLSLSPSWDVGSAWRGILIKSAGSAGGRDDGILLELALRASRSQEVGVASDGTAGAADSAELARCAVAAAEEAQSEESIDLSGLLRGFLYRMEPELRDDRIQVLPFLGGELPLVMGDRRHVESALWALLRRAWASLLPTGGTITLRTWEAEGSVWCSVADDGEGRDSEAVMGPRSLEPLRTPDHAEDPTLPDGGVEMARALIQAGGGTLHVEVRPGLWTRHAVIFPASRVVQREAAGARKALPPAVEVRRSGGGALEVLVVDDNDMVRTVLRKYLERKGYDVTEAVDGGDALEVLREHRFDRVMVDIDMPGTTGIEFFQRLDTVAPEMRERTVFMTGGFQEGSAEDFIKGTGRPHIQKPFDLKEVEELLRA